MKVWLSVSGGSGLIKCIVALIAVERIADVAGSHAVVHPTARTVWVFLEL
ncbi:MAG TPA: hypothetical protein VJH33_03345 [Candidatus Paceibacterota bacterium]